MPTNQIEDDELDDEYDDEDDYGDYGDLLSEDQWDNSPKAQALIAAMPKGWVMVKAVNFTYGSLSQMDAWLKQNSKGHYKRVGFSSGCSTNVGVQFENYVDAVMFKLRWR